jgi:hypothetical protein
VPARAKRRRFKTLREEWTWVSRSRRLDERGVSEERRPVVHAARDVVLESAVIGKPQDVERGAAEL